ncbi:helix-turn-helix transcriptional regulator [Natrialba swarupiae]|uniref:Transcriptional regulator n=1 Tax=Natrialba swarupiae TaxID=2448032 RepID=A0A5D5AFA8_9EURY|nr:transcriptional regulator [Natrialba swarupiae]TYT60446.1 transcriptional regulator [Natrialba swarupiae]
MGSFIEEIEFIASSKHRVGVLEALAEGGHDRRDLESMTGAHSSTIGRVLSDFEERRWIERNGPTYELTPLGEYVADQFADLCDAMEIEGKLRAVWQWLPREMEGFSPELFADAVIAYPPTGYPYEPLERVIQLYEENDSLRGFGATIFKGAAYEVFTREALDGMEMEFIYPATCLSAIINWNPELFQQTANLEHCNILVHDDLPDTRRCGIDIFDDRVAICCHDPETRAFRAWFDTAAPEAREWAKSVFQEYRSEARSVDEEVLATPVPEQFTSP